MTSKEHKEERPQLCKRLLAVMYAFRNRLVLLQYLSIIFRINWYDVYLVIDNFQTKLLKGCANEYDITCT